MLTDVGLDSALLPLFSQSGDTYLMAGGRDGEPCRWSQNAMEQLALDGPDEWESLLLGQELPAFQAALERMNRGEESRLTGRYHLRTRAGELIYANISLWTARDDAGDARRMGVITRLGEEDGRDPITGLPGGCAFREMMGKAAAKEAGCGFMMVGIDSFQRVNTLYSYEFGDRVLRTFAGRLADMLPTCAVLHRLEGGKFGVIYPGASKSDLIVCFSRFREIVRAPIVVADILLSLSLSGAVCLFPENGGDGEELYRNLRIAYQESKGKGEGLFTVFSDEIAVRARREMLLLEKLRESVAQGFRGFSLRYQPLVLADTGRLYGCEVLLRWNDGAFPEGVAPGEFIPVLESGGMMNRVGKWVVNAAFKQGARWNRSMPGFHISVNVTCAQFEDPGFRFFVMESLAQVRLDPSCVTLELTESSKISNPEEINHAFDFFRSQGIRIAFDDFGTGYASLEIFRVLKADELKIDRSFLERITYDVNDQKIVGEIIRLCGSMNMSVCVKGIESPEAAKIVQQLGSKLLQGYYYNRPMKAEDFHACYFAGENRARAAAAVPTPATPAAFRPMSAAELLDGLETGILEVVLEEGLPILSCNEGFRRMFGYTARQMEESFQNRALDLIRTADRGAVKRELYRQINRGDRVDLTFHAVRFDGGGVCVRAAGNAIKGRGGSVRLLLALLENGSVQKREQRLEKNCRRYQNMLRSLPAGAACVRLDENLTLDYVSPGFLELAGWAEDEMKTMFHGRFLELVYEADRQPLMTRALANPEGIWRYRMRMGNGGVLQVESAARLCAPAGDGARRCVIDLERAQGGAPAGVNAWAARQPAILFERERPDVPQRDSLTGLLTRGSLMNRIDAMLAKRRGGLFFSIDVDRLKDINRTLGHPYGDRLLRDVAARLLRFFENKAPVGRAGGDKFWAYYEFEGGPEQTGEIGARLHNALCGRFEWNGKVSFISVSIGISSCPQNGTGFIELAERADSAMYRVKERGKNGFCVFS